MSDYIQYGCGLCAPKEWLNFDVSPTLRIQKTPVLGSLLKPVLNTTFPPNVKYGDIVRGLPVKDESAKAVYCSHTLEHLSLNDLRAALQNTFKILKPGGVFRVVVPDLEYFGKRYIEELGDNREDAAIRFVEGTRLGRNSRPKGVKGIATAIYGNAEHLFMWDYNGLKNELEKAGFQNIQRCGFNDSGDEMFKLVEDEERFSHAVAINCTKPV